MAINVFLSRPTPHEEGQKLLLNRIVRRLERRGLTARTIGDTDYGREPMPHIRSVMMDCNGLLGIGFRRFHIASGSDRPQSITDSHSHGDIENRWLTSPYIHLEAAIAFQIGLPVLLFAEEGVIQEGALESGVMIMYPPTFDSRTAQSRRRFLESLQWRQLIDTWEGEVQEVVHAKGQPPRLFHR